MTSKNILITGSSSGLGKDAALTLARHGHYVFASMRNSQTVNLEAQRELLGTAKKEELALEVVDLDITNAESIRDAVNTVINSAGHIDVLVNNAGYGGYGWTESFYTQQIREMFEVNFFGILELNREVLRHMRRQRQGTIIHITSILSKLPTEFMSAYNASKFALDGYAESLNMEMSRFGAQSLILQPGFFSTDFAKNMFYPSDTERNNEYNDLAQLPMQTLQGFGAVLEMMPPVTRASEALLTLIETPAHERPLRTVVSGQPFATLVDDINKATTLATKALQEAFRKSAAVQ